METGTESASRVSCLDAVRRALALSTPFLVADPTCLAGQLVGRLASGDEPAIRRLLDDVRQGAQRPWLCPVTPALTPPGPLDRYLLGHSGGVTAVTVTADGSHIVSGDSNGQVLVWDTASGRLERALKGYMGPVGSIAVTPDGTKVVSSGSVQTIRIWDLATGKLEGTLKGHSDPVSAVAVTPDGTRAVSIGIDDVRVWDLASGKVERRFSGHTGRTLVLSPDGRRAILGASEVWDLTTGTLERTLKGHGGPFAGAAVTPDGRQIVTCGEDHKVRVWDLASGKLEHVLTGPGGTVRAVAVTADGKRLVSGSPDGALRIWDITSGRLERTIVGHIGAVVTLAATPDGRRIVSGGPDRTVRVWDLGMAEWGHVPEGHSEGVNAVVSTPDGSHIISGARDGVVRIWDFASGTARLALTGHTNRVRAVAVTSDGRRVLSGGDGELRCWNLASGRCEHVQRTWVAWAMATTPDGRQMVLSRKNGLCDGVLSVLDLKSWEIQRQLRGSVGETFGLAITADGKRIVSASQDGVVRVWDLASGTLQQSIGSARKMVQRPGGLQLDGTAVGAVAVTPDGKLIVSGSDDGKLRVFNLLDGTLKRRLKAHSKPVRAVAVTLDGRRIISGGDDGTIRIWDIEMGREIASWKTEPGIWILACCVAATDSCLIAYGDSAGRVNVLRLLE